MSSTNMAKRTAAGTLALAVCLGGGALALAGAVRDADLLAPPAAPGPAAIPSPAPGEAP